MFAKSFLLLKVYPAVFLTENKTLKKIQLLFLLNRNRFTLNFLEFFLTFFTFLKQIFVVITDWRKDFQFISVFDSCLS
jgi:hypothetical protein